MLILSCGLKKFNINRVEFSVSHAETPQFPYPNGFDNFAQCAFADGSGSYVVKIQNQSSGLATTPRHDFAKSAI
jgi:hypothetical protein